jgi:hypothetical protein
MAISAGDLAATTGTAKRIYDVILANAAAVGLGAFSDPAAQSMMKALSYCIAKGVVDAIKNDAVVSVLVETTDSGLQRAPNPNVADADTQGPATDKVLNGSII